jgi:uncharacterized protein
MQPTAGLSFKPQHFQEAVACRAVGQWYEVHAENYMVAGGPRLAMLQALRDHHPVSLHGVGLSLAADAEVSRLHLGRLRALVDRFDPILVSEHLAWSVWRGAYLPDLLPFPRSHAALRRICDNVDRTQAFLGRRILVENPALYLQFEGHDLDETEFLGALVRATGCGLLVDVNNIVVSAHNLGFDPHAYVDALPLEPVLEIHLAGHASDERGGERLLIDTHDSSVAPDVWRLYERLIARTGPRPTLIERDDRVPAFGVLMGERTQAAELMARARGPTARRLAAHV